MLRKFSLTIGALLLAILLIVAGLLLWQRSSTPVPPRLTEAVTSLKGKLRHPAALIEGGADAAADADEPVHFVAFGDSGKGCARPSDGQCRVAAAIERICAARGCDFALMLGDNIYDSGVTSADDPQFRSKFELPYARLDFPFYVALGNHDYGTGGAGLDFAKGENEVAYTAKSKKWKMPARVFHVAVANLELVALDTQQVLLGNDAQQREDVKAWLAASTATWKIVFGHHPYLSNGPHGNAGNYDGLGFLPGVIPAAGKNVRSFMSEVVCGASDLYLAGHDHSRQWMRDACKTTELVVSGGGAAPTHLVGENPTRFQRSTVGFLFVSIRGRHLTAQFIDDRGEVEFERQLDK